MRRSARPEVTGHNFAGQERLRRPGFRSVSPAPNPSSLNDLRSRSADAGSRKWSRVETRWPFPTLPRERHNVVSQTCTPAERNRENFLVLAASSHQEPENGELNPPRLRISGAPRLRPSSRLPSPALVALVPLRVPSQPPVRPQQTRRICSSIRNHQCRDSRHRLSGGAKLGRCPNVRIPTHAGGHQVLRR